MSDVTPETIEKLEETAPTDPAPQTDELPTELVINRGTYVTNAQKVSDDIFFSQANGPWKAVQLLVGKTHAAASGKGWWDKTTGNAANILEGRLFRTISELTEAWEELRKPNAKPMTIYWKMDEHGQMKPEGVPVELADAVIRLFDVAAYFSIDLAEAIRIKMKFNEGRPYRHGNKQA